jgi:hypothetical protein
MDALKQANTVLRKLGVATTTVEVLHYRDQGSGCTGCDETWENHCIFCKLPIDEAPLDADPRDLGRGRDHRYPGWPIRFIGGQELQAFGRMCFPCLALRPHERPGVDVFEWRHGTAHTFEWRHGTAHTALHRELDPDTVESFLL